MSTSSLSPLLYTDLLMKALDEDIGQVGDVTSQAVIPQGTQATLTARAREVGVLAGIEIAAAAFELVDPTLEIEILAQDGDALTPAQEILRVSGDARALLLAERTALNVLSHMCGVASETRKLVEAIAGTKAAICDTRKTNLGLRALEKYAVTCGGGQNHRFGLHDAMMIKDNHIAIAGGLEQAVEAALQNKGHMVKLEVEVDTLEQLDRLLPYNIDVVLLDNMSPETLAQAVKMVDGKFVCEASGGVKLETVRAIAESGVDLISVGWVTHSAPALDIGLDFVVG